MKGELGAKTMINFVGLRAKTYNLIIDDPSEGEEAKAQKCVS